MKNSPYLDQVRLILRVLPHVLAERRFALKGGTAINLFVRDMPRMSIDVDLTWLPLQPRDMALENMGFALSGIADAIRTKLPGAMVRENRMRNASHILSGSSLGMQRPQSKSNPTWYFGGLFFHVKSECYAMPQRRCLN